MPSMLIIIIVLFLALSLTACNGGKATSDSNISPKVPESGSDLSSGNPSEADQHVSFDANDDSKNAYKDYVAELWEGTKTALRADLGAEYTDEEYQDLGIALEFAWENVYPSPNQGDEADATDDITTYTNVIGDIKELINKGYGNWGIGTPEEREKNRKSLREGDLEEIIEKVDKIIYSESGKTPLTEKDFMGVWGIQLTTDKSMLLVNDKQYDSGIVYTGTASGIEYGGVVYSKGAYQKFGGVACFRDTDDSPSEITIRIMEKDHSGTVLKVITLKSGESVPFEIDIPQIESLYIRNTPTDRVPTSTIPDIMMIADPYFGTVK